MYTNVNWRSGIILSPELFIQNDEWYKNSITGSLRALINTTINKGLTSGEIDHILLNKGILSIKYLSWIDLPNNLIIEINQEDNLFINLLEEEIDVDGNIFLNCKRYKKNINNIESINTKYSLSVEQDLLAEYSFVICQLKKQDNVWKIKGSKHLINLSNHFALPFLNKVHGYLNLIESEYVVNLDPNYRFYFKQKIKIIKYKIIKSIAIEIPLSTVELFNDLIELINLCEGLSDQELDRIHFHNDMNKTFSQVFFYFEKWLQLPKKVSYQILEKENNYFISKIFSNEIIQSPKWYLIVKANNDIDIKEWKVNWIKVCAPSRKKVMDNLALSGVNINEISNKELEKINYNESDYTKVFSIQPSNEFDYILSDKKICCLTNNEKAYSYDYIFYYS